MSNMQLNRLVGLFETTHKQLQKRAAHSVDTALVIRNWLFGCYIVEFENGAATRAELYGKKLIRQLSSELRSRGIKGTSTTNLNVSSLLPGLSRDWPDTVWPIFVG